MTDAHPPKANDQVPRSIPCVTPTAARSRALLSFDAVCVRFGGITALDSVSFALAPGEVCGLIGPNGAGKTTLFNCVSGLYVPSSGDIRFEGVSVCKLQPHAIAKLGIARTFQNLALFDSQSVLFNVLCGMHITLRSGLAAQALGRQAVRQEEDAARARAEALLDELGLGPLAHQRIDTLSLGLRKRVEVARALASQPKLLMLDEPASGLSTAEQNELGDLIAALRVQKKLAVLVVEHRMRWVKAVCSRAVALNFGRVVADGTPEAVSAHPEVIAAWLGQTA